MFEGRTARGVFLSFYPQRRETSETVFEHVGSRSGANGLRGAATGEKISGELSKNSWNEIREIREALRSVSINYDLG
jgi:hypothetical protein